MIEGGELAADVRHTEELALNAWPALETLALDGWLLRISGGYTRRANCVLPLYPSTRPLAEKIAWCEQLYGAHGLPALFKLTAQTRPAELDAELERRAYAREAESAVLRLELLGLAAGPDREVELAPRVSGAWLAALARLSGLDERQHQLAERMLDRLVPRACFATLHQDGAVLAVGLGVIDRGELGLFDLVTDPDARGRGLGRRLVLQILDWARARGAHSAYLQVGADNAAALHLYEKLGFHEAYRYWYRRAPA